MDIFDTKILCNKCGKEMKKTKVNRDGFLMRAVRCDKCKTIALHPADQQEYENWKKLKTKQYRVKLRLVGNSYAVSIPKEIVNFMKEQEKMMDDMVKLAFDEAQKLSLVFGKEKN